ncbi:MAG: hypothetical protein OEM28_04130 [Nitrosopumilus sp.]|nr:hypothetical protein [Nitrosopumilus sp.]MDH3486579.1 hypothetical protein [Nitrosopumilus sp.]
MSSVRPPRMPRPRIPKIKKPSISKAKRLRLKPSGISLKQTLSKPSAIPKHKGKKKGNKRNTGTCYFQSRCRNVLARDVTKTQCKKMGGKSWRKTGGTCERFEQSDHNQRMSIIR